VIKNLSENVASFRKNYDTDSYSLSLILLFSKISRSQGSNNVLTFNNPFRASSQTSGAASVMDLPYILTILSKSLNYFAFVPSFSRTIVKDKSTFYFIQFYLVPVAALKAEFTTSYSVQF